MAKDDLSKHSSEEMRALTRSIADLPKQTAELVNQMKTGEAEAAEKRVEALTSYFEVYSNKLNTLKSQQNALIDDTFSNLNKKLTESYTSASSDIAKLKKELKELADTTNNIRSSAQRSTPTKRKSQSQQKQSSSIPENHPNSYRSYGRLRNTQENSFSVAGYFAPRNNNFMATSSGGGFGGSSGSAIGDAADSTKIIATQSEETTDLLQKEYEDLNAVLAELDGTREAQEAQLLARRKERYSAHLNEMGMAAKKAHELELDLSIARERTDKEIEADRAEFRINKIKEVRAAELEAQNFLNKLTDEIAAASQEATMTDATGNKYNEAGALAADGASAKEDLAAAQEFAAQRAKFIADAEREAMLANNGVLTAADATRIRQEANQKFDLERDLQELKLKHLKEEQKVRALETLKKDRPEVAAAREKQLAAALEEEKYRLQKQYGRALNEQELKALREQKELEFDLSEENLKRIEKQRQKDEAEAQKEEEKNRRKKGSAAIEAAVTGPLDKDNNLLKRFDDLKSIVDKVDDENKGIAAMAVAAKAISSLVKQLENSIDKIASYQGGIDTRLQGSNMNWTKLNLAMMSVGAVTPFFRQETFAENIKSLVNQGISFDIKQRAFLMTIQEKIANTFNVADGTLLRLIRIQQEDSTAGRLGMESALNSFLNEMYETSEYLTDVAAGVRSSLEEMEALMAGAEATEVEYQVQKWMGSLYSVGMSKEAVQGIAGALGQIASGQVDGLTGGNGAGNLLVMAANEAGLAISDILADGLNADETNKLLQATVNYLAEIAESSKDNKVVQQQLANVFGVKASDLRAATNLASDNKAVFKENKTYENMIRQLNNMAGSMIMRTSIGEMMTNIWENGQYSIASSMATNPVSYLLFKVAKLLEEGVGGIPIPFINAMGFGVDLETTVADLMRVASVSTGILGSLGPMISGLASSFSGRAMLATMGIGLGSGLDVVARGGGGGGIESLAGLGAGATEGSGGGSQSTSGSGYVGNSSSSDIKESTMQGAEDDKKQQMVEAKEEQETTDVQVINTNVLKIYELLEDVTNGKRSLHVKMEGYGLIGAPTSAGGAQGGVAGAENRINSSTNGFTSNNIAGSDNNTTLGGWSTL